MKRDLKKGYFEINFTENQVEMEYIKIPKNININYSDIIHLRYTRQKSGSFNIMSYQENGKIKKVVFFTVADHDGYINFLKWMREKNNNIAFDAYPPDGYMEYKIQENFGFKYRKFLKNSL